MEVLFVLLMLLVLGGVVVWLYRANAADLQKLEEQLGLAVIPKGETESGPDPVMGTYWQQAVLAGELHGFPAVVMRRNVRRTSRYNNKNSSLFTVLALELPAPTPFRLRVEPALTGQWQAFFGGDLPAVTTGDVSFDQSHRVATDDAEAALRLLDEPIRAMLMAFRGGSAPGMPDHFLGKLSADLMTGVFAVEGRRVSFTISGTPTARLGDRLQMAARLLAEMARRLNP